MCFLMSGNSGAHLVVHTVTLSKEGDKERLIVLSLRPKAMAAVAMFHGAVRDVGYNGPVGRMHTSTEIKVALT